VKIAKREDSGDLSGSVTEATDYVFRKAAALGRPAAVNVSVGGQGGPHDGSGDENQVMNALVGAGKVVVLAAGNEGNRPLHVGYSLRGTSVETGTKVAVRPSKTRIVGFSTHLFVESGSASLELRFTDQGKTLWSSGVIPPGGKLPPTTFRAYGVNVFRATIDASSRTSTGLIAVLVRVEYALGIFRFTETGSFDIHTFGSGRLEGWLSGGSFELASDPSGAVVGGDTKSTVTDECTASRVLAVGNHTTKTKWTDLDGHPWDVSPEWTVGSIAFDGGRGPSRDGRTKPDVTAPGSIVVSTLSKELDLSDQSLRQWVVQGGAYRVMKGTSLSAAHVTGLVALMLEASPTVTPEDARKILQETARSDSSTGTTPNQTWGAGKVDALAAVKVLGGDAPKLYMLGKKVSAKVTWRNQHSGARGNATPIPKGDQFGFFHFGDAANPEVFVKALDFGASRPFLLFASGLTNFDYSVTYRNVRTGQKVVFFKPAEAYTGFADATSMAH